VIDEIAAWSHGNGLRLHMDGARLFNASVASGIPVKRICRDVDSVSICFSKGLGCPMGSMLISDAETIARARKARKIFGGGLRQAGIPAASAIYALENHVQRLADDHDNARAFAEAVARIPGVTVDPPDVQSNLVFITLALDLGAAAEISARLKERGVLIYPYGPQRLRACTHLDVDRAAVLQAAAMLAESVGAAKSAPAARKAAAGPYSG
jgi:threonine aldolase